MNTKILLLLTLIMAGMTNIHAIFEADSPTESSLTASTHRSFDSFNQEEYQKEAEERFNQNTHRKAPETRVTSNPKVKSTPNETSHQISLKIDTDEQEEIQLRKALTSLPSKFRPANVDDALQIIKDGKIVADLINRNKFYDAIAINLPLLKSTSDTAIHDSKVFKQALNTDDSTFWELIKNNEIIKKSIQAHKINFTFQEFQKPENNLYFRNTFIRKNLQNPEHSLGVYQKAYQTSVVQLQWHLYARSILQDQAFSSGMITFKQPHFQTFKFLDGYAELVSPKYKLHANISFHSLTTTKAYTRESSHWGGQVGLKGLNFGIDIQDNNGKPLDILPGNKSHLLFGLRTNNMTFVKWENYGVTFNPIENDISIIKHTGGYFHKRNKEDNAALERREKLPNTVFDKFKELYGKELTKEEEKSIKVNGITTLRQILAHDSYAKAQEFDAFLINEMNYQPTTLDIRKGGEIILPDQPS